MKHKILPSETVLPDDYPLHAGYVYIMDGLFKRALISMTCVSYKSEFQIKEIRRCELFKHDGARLGDAVE